MKGVEWKTEFRRKWEDITIKNHSTIVKFKRGGYQLFCNPISDTVYLGIEPK